MSELQFEMTDVSDQKEDDLAQFDLSLKKKKKKKKTESSESKENHTENINEDYMNEKEEEYDYIFLLNRLFNLVRENNPSLASRKKQIIPAPVLAKLGTKKTMWANFSATVQILRREMDHIMSYISSEMTTECSIDGNLRLIMKGKFTSKTLEPVLKKYIIEYVSCHMCRGHETSIIKDPITRLCFLSCDMCKSSRSVNPIKKAFKA